MQRNILNVTFVVPKSFYQPKPNYTPKKYTPEQERILVYYKKRIYLRELEIRIKDNEW